MIISVFVSLLLVELVVKEFGARGVEWFEPFGAKALRNFEDFGILFFRDGQNYGTMSVSGSWFRGLARHDSLPCLAKQR